MTSEQKRIALQSIYLDWINNYLTVERFAVDMGIGTSDAAELLELCHKVHEEIVRDGTPL